MLPIALRLIVIAAIGAGLWAALRQIARESRGLAWVVALGIAARVALTLLLLSLSLFRTPTPPPYPYAGDRFWWFAPDADMYYVQALDAIQHGLGSIPPGTGSISYLQTLAIWMMVVGVHPLSAIFSNLVCYVAGCSLLIAAARSMPADWRRPATLISVGAWTGSPMLIFHGIQPLKDTLFVFLIFLICFGVSLLSSSLAGAVTRRSRYRAIGGAAAILAGTFMTAGMRTYFSFLTWACLAVFFVLTAATGALPRLVRTMAAGTAILAAGWMAFTYGAGAYAAQYVRLLTPGAVERIGSRLVTAHNGFVLAGGRTNVNAPAAPAAPPVPADAGRPPEAARPSEDQMGGSIAPLRGDAGMAGRLKTVAVGVATMFVPMTLLKFVGIAKVAAGGKLLLMTDVDTLFFDLAIAACAYIAMRNWRGWRSAMPYGVFVLSMSLILTITMAYVVTNYGTLVRLRLMVAAPIWSLAFGLRRDR